ncbi:MAG: MBL fold metallo-hydrolase [Alphaproteobacteria bacterium]|nr:MBL fold metallo-hydrolase [Alphaproteobacteria bacterium]
MIFRQLFDSVSSTYTYLLASRKGGEALLIDPVFEKTDRYLRLMEELDLKLVKVLDTHVHADHITAMGALRDETNCVTVMGAQSPVDVVSMRVTDGDSVSIEGLNLEAMFTPGHTDDSYSFKMNDRVFTGDTLMIRGTGRTDFQNGDAGRQYDSIFGKLLALPDDMKVYPAHDYKGDMVSTILEERMHNPRLQVTSRDQYIDLMNSLDLPNPKMMDVAVPENIKMGINLDRQREYPSIEASALLDHSKADMMIVDLREDSEVAKTGILPDALRAPFSTLNNHIPMLAKSGARNIVFYCAAGERSAMAVQQCTDNGIKGCMHIPGGFSAWQSAGGKSITA